MKARTMTNKIPPDCVFTFEHLTSWLDEAENFAKSILKVGSLEFYARSILEYAGAIRSAATFNNEAGPWRDDRVSWLMDRCAIVRHEAEEIAAKIRQSNTGRDYGKAGGDKGGRPSKKPMRVDLKQRYDNHLAACGSHREARAELVKGLSKDEHVSLATARAWLRDADI